MNSLANRRYSDSWIEVSSRPSSSSLSSVADEIITTGLRVQDPKVRRRRKSLRPVAAVHRFQKANHGTSSAEEYEESESEPDHVMTSSNELGPAPKSKDSWRPNDGHESGTSSGNAYASEEASEDDENATAVGTNKSTFTPQPNAFSSRPVSSRQHSSLPTSHQYPYSRPQSNPRHSYPSQAHSPYNVISPSHQADHDAALRASLSTLLSCAAAARKSKLGQTQLEPRFPSTNRVDPTTIGIVPESAIIGSGPVTTLEEMDPDKTKRKVAAQGSQSRSNSKERRAAKKPRRTVVANTAMIQDVSPTLLTWVVGASMLVLVGAVSFSAGYAVGRETGQAEAAGIGEIGVEVKRTLASKGSSGIGLRRWATGAAIGVAA